MGTIVSALTGQKPLNGCVKVAEKALSFHHTNIATMSTVSKTTGNDARSDPKLDLGLER